MPHRLVPNPLHALPAPPPHRNRSDNQGAQLGGAQNARLAHLRPPPPQRGYPRSLRAELLFDVISTAYERTSPIVTTNLPFENSVEVLGSERLTGATLDRLTHRCQVGYLVLK